VVNLVAQGWSTSVKTGGQLGVQSGNPGTGMCGISMNSHNTSLSEGQFAPHIQSFFLYTSMQVLRDVFPNGLAPDAPSAFEGKNNLILHGEIGISQRVLAAGYSLSCKMFPESSYKAGDPWTLPEGDLRITSEYREQANLC
jgi:hypothetical protein